MIIQGFILDLQQCHQSFFSLSTDHGAHNWKSVIAKYLVRRPTAARLTIKHLSGCAGSHRSLSEIAFNVLTTTGRVGQIYPSDACAACASYCHYRATISCIPFEMFTCAAVAQKPSAIFALYKFGARSRTWHRNSLVRGRSETCPFAKGRPKSNETRHGQK